MPRLLLFLFLLSSALAGGVAAQHRVEPFPRWVSPRLVPSATRQDGPAARSSSTIGMLGGGLLGGAVGFAVGALAGSAVGGGNAICGDDACGLEEAAWGAAIGESVLLPLGIHLVNRRRGNYGLSLLASAGIAGVGILAVDATNDGWPLIPVPVAQLVSSILIERATAGR